MVSCKRTLNQTERAKNMGKSQIAALLVVGMFVLAAGCEMAGGPSDEAQLTAALGRWKAALEAQDLDKMMEPYSDDYKGGSGEGGREGVRLFLKGMMDEGALEDVEMDISEAEIKIEGDKATVGPIRYSSDEFEIEMMRTLKKESDGVWRVVAAERY
jgi:ketosteroid isomerase-like protein